jgi:hypothetical protein
LGDKKGKSGGDVSLPFEINKSKTVTAEALQSLYRASERGAQGAFPLGAAAQFHCGADLLVERGKAICSIAYAEVVAARIGVGPGEHPWGDTGFVLLRHPLKGNKSIYSLFVHLQREPLRPESTKAGWLRRLLLDGSQEAGPPKWRVTADVPTWNDEDKGKFSAANMKKDQRLPAGVYEQEDRAGSYVKLKGRWVKATKDGKAQVKEMSPWTGFDLDAAASKSPLVAALKDGKVAVLDTDKKDGKHRWTVQAGEPIGVAGTYWGMPLVHWSMFSKDAVFATGSLPDKEPKDEVKLKELTLAEERGDVKHTQKLLEAVDPQKKTIGKMPNYIPAPGEVPLFYRTPAECWRSRYLAVKGLTEFALDVEKFLQQERHQSHTKEEREAFKKNAQIFLFWKDLAKADGIPQDGTAIFVHPATALRLLPPLVIDQRARGTLEIHQTGSHWAQPVLLGAFEVSSDKPVSAGQSDIEPPWSLEWNTRDGQLLGTAELEADQGFRIDSFERNQSDEQCVRSLGGRGREERKPHPGSLRGGYLFAPASAEDSELKVKGREHPEQLLLAVDLSFNKGKTKYRVPLLYGKNPREDWIYDEHDFKLSFTLKVGERSWSADGPQLTSPACEFKSDAGKSAEDLKRDLSKEYGNLSAKPPLHARDMSDCLNAESPIADAFRTHLVAAAQFVNGKIPADAGFTVTPLEIASTFLSEGGVSEMRRGIASGKEPDKLKFNGYGDLGIDSYGTRWKAREGHLRAYTAASLERFLTDPREANLEKGLDEQKHPWKTFKRLSLEEAVYAVAGLYAFFKERFARAVADESLMGPWVTTASELPLHVQHFWSTFYFNTSSGKDRGTEQIRKGSVDWHDTGWKLEDDFEKYKMFGLYNATWRVATFRLLQRLVTL